jgi:hypothetical protein
MKRNKGQAMAEYAVLYPGMIIISIAVLWIVGGSAKDLLRRSINQLMDHTSAPTTVCEEDITGQDGGSYCEQHEGCDHIEPLDAPSCGDFNNCGVVLDWNPGVVVIKAGLDYHIHIEAGEQYSYTTPDGCYSVSYSSVGGGTLQWQKVGGGPSCQDVSHVQSWQVDTVASCQ